MKTVSIIRILISLVMTGLIISCSSNRILSTDSGKNIDKRLLGIWKGCEQGQEFENITKCWKMDRKRDGTFTIEYSTQLETGLTKTTEDGIWWVENDKFFEFHNISQMTDIYDYTIISKDEVQFNSIKMAFNMYEENYNFIDYRDGSKKEKQLFDIKDASSIEKAIKVKSISEEYEYVAQVYKDCQFIEQLLIFNKKKPYDILNVKKPDGSTVSYYFDISSFYGSW